MGFDTEVMRMNNTVPSCTQFVDPTLPAMELETQVRRVCRTLLEKWFYLDDNQLSVTPVSGGITNLLLKVSVHSDKEEEPVTVRVFGPNTDAVIDRKREIQAIPSLSGAAFGARLLGVFANGMVQSFIDAQTLTPMDIRQPDFAARIAREVRRLHELEVPGSKDPQLWLDIFKFLDKASALIFEDNPKQRRYEMISFDELRAEVQSVKEVSDALRAPVVFSHNDLLSGNFMFDEDKGKLYMIDFEYGSYNYRGYDIANHFAEYAGFECDYSLYPGRDAQYHFFRHYICPSNPQEVLQDELEQLYVETNFYALASHLFWSLWAIVQAKFSSIDFDYLDYFFQRYKEYTRRKFEFFSLVNSYLAKRQQLNNVRH
eukprot:c27071_g1_i1 orf=658-1773(-)